MINTEQKENRKKKKKKKKKKKRPSGSSIHLLSSEQVPSSQHHHHHHHHHHHLSQHPPPRTDLFPFLLYVDIIIMSSHLLLLLLLIIIIIIFLFLSFVWLCPHGSLLLAVSLSRGSALQPSKCVMLGKRSASSRAKAECAGGETASQEIPHQKNKKTKKQKKARRCEKLGQRVNVLRVRESLSWRNYIISLNKKTASIIWWLLFGSESSDNAATPKDRHVTQVKQVCRESQIKWEVESS